MMHKKVCFQGNSQLNRRGFLQKGLAMAAGVPAVMRPGGMSLGAESKATAIAATALEDIRSSQNTVLEAVEGIVEKVRVGAQAFVEGKQVLSSLPEEFLARKFIRSKPSGVKAVCRRAGYVYAVAAGGEAAKQLVKEGFKQLDFPAFEVLGSDDGTKALIYQKPVAEGDKLEFDGWVTLIFGPEERGGVLYEKMRSLDPPAYLPDGSEFKTWEVPLSFSRTYYVEQSHPEASDSNPGTKERPFKTINQAAQVLEPGERVVVGEGVYRECVRPARGGTDPEHMISYEAAGAKVVIKGAEILKVKWVKSLSFLPSVKDLWMSRLPPELFGGYNPFAISNYHQGNTLSLSGQFGDSRSRVFLQVRGLLFQNGRRLRQVSLYADLSKNEGSFWVETNGLTIHIRPFGDIDPNQAEWEGTTREQIFAPEEYYLGYIRVKGFTMEYAGNSFPFPQRGAISTMIGHHWIIEDNTLQWVNGVGIDIATQGGYNPPRFIPPICGHHIVRRNIVDDIGTTGITGPGPDNSLIEDNVFRRNAWHDCEHLAECAAIKTHQNLNVLIRRNLIIDTVHGPGIWIDNINSNSRICQNVIVNSGSNYGIEGGTGGIYIEAALAPNMVDHNVVWGSTYTNGIYAYSASRLIVAHNLIANCALAGICLIDVAGRQMGNRTIPAGNNKVFNNLLLDNGWDFTFFARNNFSDHNLLGRARKHDAFRLLDKMQFPVTISALDKGEELDLTGWRKNSGYDLHSSEVKIAAEFNPDTLELVWSVQGDITEGLPIDGIDHDFWGNQIKGRTVAPGPFGSVPRNFERIIADPRRHHK